MNIYQIYLEIDEKNDEDSRGPSSSNYQTVQKNLQLKTFELIQGGLSSANSADQLRDSQSTPPRPLEISNKN